jgi:hypothetical protein
MQEPQGRYMDPRLAALFTRQRENGFSDLRGAHGDLTIPISDRLLNDAAAAALPPSAPVRDLRLAAHAGNRIGVRFKIASASFLPPLNLTVVIDRQPELPASPVLVLKLEMGGLLSLAGPALRFLDALPAGIRVEQERIYLDLAVLLAERGLAELLQYVEKVQVTTTQGALVLTLRAGVRGAAPDQLT